jgi:phosphonoacetaldehyde hydrolase
MNTAGEPLIEAVVFDWAGTVIDFGSLAPMGAFVRVFEDFGIKISISDARGPMGMAKLDHIRAIGGLSHVNEQWLHVHNCAFDEAAALAVYEKFLPINRHVVTDYADVIDGVGVVVADLRSKGIKIGSTTGYTRDIMARILPLAAEQGFEPDNLVCAGDLWTGRPTPVMMWKTFLDLELTDSTRVVKVDDTPVGISEGIASGTWTVGVSASGNEMGLSRAQWLALDPQQQLQRMSQASRRLLQAGAHFVIPTVASLPSVLEVVEYRLAQGMRP